LAKTVNADRIQLAARLQGGKMARLTTCNLLTAATFVDGFWLASQDAASITDHN
jgi:hypothetical protein